MFLLPFATVSEHLCITDKAIDVAFVPILEAVTTAQCLDFLRQTHCRMMSAQQTMELLNLIGEDELPKQGRVISPPQQGNVFVTTRDQPQMLSSATIWGPGDYILCRRPSCIGMSSSFAKVPFEGRCKMIDSESAW